MNKLSIGLLAGGVLVLQFVCLLVIVDVYADSHLIGLGLLGFWLLANGLAVCLTDLIKK